MIRKFVVVLVIISTLVIGCSSRIISGVHLTKVVKAIPDSASQEPFPMVESISPIGKNLKETDLGILDFPLLESNGGKLLFAVSWHGKTWEFKGTCSHEEMRIKLVLGENSLKGGESEWVLLPPATMELRYTYFNNGATLSVQQVYVTCKNEGWFFGNYG